MPTSSVYSILFKKENAHDDPIYCSAWVKTNTTGEPKDLSKEFIVTGGLDGLVKVWQFDNDKLELLHTLEGHLMSIVSVAVSPDGHTIASTSLDSMLIIWDLLSGNKVHEVQTGATDVWEVVFSPDGTLVATGGHSGKIVIYGVQNGKQEKLFDTRGKFVLSIAWSADGQYIASGAIDGAVCIFDVAQEKLLHTIEAHTKSVRSVAFSSNSQLLVTASEDGNVKIYNVVSASMQHSAELKFWALCTRFSPDGTRVAASAADGTVRVMLADGLQVLNTFKEHAGSAWHVQFNPKSNKLLSVSKDKSIIIYECPIPPKNTKK